MNKLLVAIALTLSFSLTAIAAEDTHSPAKRVEWLTKAVGLNADQQAKVTAIYEQQEAKNKALKEDTQTQVKAVLTPEQITTMEAKHAEHIKQRADKKGKND
jgi:Spy/CpxP family protein refolding chaperone